MVVVNSKPAGEAANGKSGADDSVRVFNAVRSGLAPALGDKTATKYALFAQDVYVYIQTNPAVQEAIRTYKDWKDGKEIGEGLDKIDKANQYLSNAKEMGLTSATNGFRDVRAGGAAGILNVFVDEFEGYARANGIVLNECSLQVTKVALDIATAGVFAASVWGVFVAGFAVFQTFKDSYALGQACFTSK